MFNTTFRVDLERRITMLKSAQMSECRDIAIMKLKEAIMWLGEDSRSRRKAAGEGV